MLFGIMTLLALVSLAIAFAALYRLRAAEDKIVAREVDPIDLSSFDVEYLPRLCRACKNYNEYRTLANRNRRYMFPELYRNLSA